MRYICTFCNTFVYDEKLGDKRAKLAPGTTYLNLPDSYRCPVCSHPASYLQPISDAEFERKKENYDRMFPQPTDSQNLAKGSSLQDSDNETRRASSGQGPSPRESNIDKVSEDKPAPKDIVDYRDIARRMLAGVCAVNKVCDGDPDRLCMGMRYGRPIGFGGAGQGMTWSRNFTSLSRYLLKMRVIKPHKEPSFETTFLGHPIKMPVMVTSMSGTTISMNNSMPEPEFQRGMIEGAKLFGTIGMSGNTVDFPDHPGIDIIRENDGWGIPVFKPQSQERLLSLFKQAQDAKALAIGIDLDGYGSTNWAYRGKPVYRKSEEDLKELISSVAIPVICKGIMSIEDVRIAYDCGAKAVDISNHGGRVMDYGQGVSEILPGIADEFKGKVTIMADGAIRTGFDVLKILALGADVALIGRELGRMALSGGKDAVNKYLQYVQSDLRLAMLMTSCDNLKEITRDILIMPRIYDTKDMTS